MDGVDTTSHRISLRLSQSSLDLWATCPRKFQHIYIDQLATYTLPEERSRQRLGSQFHALVQQWQLGLPVEPLAEGDRPLQRWLDTFIQAAPEIFGGDSGTTQLSEHTRTLEFDGALVTVVYDLLILGQTQAQILDWKTYARPRDPQPLLHNWQTRLYLFVLVETSAYSPEQIAMVYWFFPSTEDAAKAQTLSIAYSHEQHEQTRRSLHQVLAELGQQWAAYQQGQPLPQVPWPSPLCQDCSFARRCDRAIKPPPPSLANIADIPEMAL
jgi:hypothetical protein